MPCLHLNRIAKSNCWGQHFSNTALRPSISGVSAHLLSLGFRKLLTMCAEAIVTGIIAGTLSPLVLSWLQHKVIWQTQKKLEMKHSIFVDAVRALSLWSRDAMDIELQDNKAAKEITRQVEIRPETMEMIEKSKGMVNAFFSDKTYAAYDLALRAHLSLENIPNEDFEQKRTAAIIAMAKELGIKS